MTEPAVASSDATNIEARLLPFQSFRFVMSLVDLCLASLFRDGQCSIQRSGDYYVINGRKWWTSGAMVARSFILGLSLALAKPTCGPFACDSGSAREAVYLDGQDQVHGPEARAAVHGVFSLPAQFHSLSRSRLC
jgi:hypothetical protein